MQEHNNCQPIISLGKHKIGKGQPCFIIAEAGTAHEGQLERGFRLIEAAKLAGAGCIKFQIVFAHEIVHPLCGAIDLPGGKISIYERFCQLEQNLSFYQELKNEAEKQGLIFLASVFGPKSADLLLSLKPLAIKIASPELNHLPLLKLISQSGLPVFFSTGVSRLADIEVAVSLFKPQTALLHCVTSYPALPEEYNLRLLPPLSSLFNIPCGVSDHSLDPFLVPLTALLVNATIIEKHLTLSHADKGLDDKIALEPSSFKDMVDSIREAERINKTELKIILAKRFGEKRLAKILGTGIKQLAPSEKNNFSTTRRSIMAIKDIKAGEVFSEHNLAILRSEKNLTPGLEPAFYEILIGRRARHLIKSSQGIDWTDVD